MPDKIEQLADLIFDIQTGRREGKIKFVVGDGFYSQNGIRSREIIIGDARSQGRRINSEKDEDRCCWQVYETYRFHTSNCIPPKRYFYTHHLCKAELISSIITTNYDLYFDSIFTKEPLPHGIIFNPAISDNEDSGKEFYGKLSASNEQLRLWKVHGSFSHVSFMNSSHGHNHIFRLPNFSICYPIDNPIDDYGLPSHFFMGVTCDCDRIAHFIDMNFNRRYFDKAIDGSIQDLNNNDTAAIIVLGFTGRYDPANPDDEWNEELVPHLIALSRRVPVYSILAPFQDPDDSYLYNQLNSDGTALKGNMEIILKGMLKHYYDKLGMNGSIELRNLDRLYVSSWVNGNLFNVMPYE